MEMSPLLRWLGALAIMLVVVLIVVPLLLDTVGRTVQVGEPSEGGGSELAALGSEAPSAEASRAADEEPQEDEGGGDFPQRYTVEAGDTGTKISEQFYDSPDGWPAIAEANDIDPSAPLRVGVELEIPPPE